MSRCFHQNAFLSLYFDSVYELFTKYTFPVNRYFAAYLYLGVPFPGIDWNEPSCEFLHDPKLEDQYEKSSEMSLDRMLNVK